ncbi:MAG: YHS domain-containing (seleno)protein [Pseudomonadota bacterium]
MTYAAVSRAVSALFASLLGLAVFAGAAAAAKPEIYTGRFSSQAVQGYDVVSYFTDGAPVKGDKAFSTEYKGATWLFSSAANRDAFLENPDQYAPQYGGYCAWAIAQGSLAKGDARHWSIVDGKLYLNFNKKVKADWEKDIPGFIAAADANWPGILDQ